MEFGYTGAEFTDCKETHKRLAKEYQTLLEDQVFGDEYYIENVAKGFAHYWLYSSEDMPCTIGNFYNILDENFTIKASNRLGVISDREEAISWLDSFRRAARYSYHKIENLKATSSEDSTSQNQKIIIEMTLEYFGLGITGSKINNKFEYRWFIEKKDDEEYPKIREMDFKIIDKFSFIK
jgi:hypothetical protein